MERTASGQGPHPREASVAGRYKLTRQIGSKDGTRTFLARGDGGAATVIEMTSAGPATHLARLADRARAVASLSHPYFPHVYGFGLHGSSYYVAREYVRGVNLKTLAAGGPMRPIDAVGYVLRACQALATAHAEGIVHGDLRPHNLIVTDDGAGKVLEFAMPSPDGTLSARTSEVPEFWHYASPEEIAGRQLTPASDVYSLGVVLYELVTGSVPFDGHTAEEVRNKHLKEYPQPPSRRHGAVQPILDGVILSALAKVPDFRSPSAVEMLWDLRAVAREMRHGRGRAGRL